MKKNVFITGATSGIGEATAVLLASDYNLIICGRRAEKLKELEQKLSQHTDVVSLSFDVRDKEAVEKAMNTLPERWQNIDILINNAGNAHGMDTIDMGSTDDWDAMIDINVKGLLYVSKSIIPRMIKRQTGHIVNIGSIAGKETYPKGNVYCASKAAVQSISDGMRLDLYQHNIKVTSLHPGLVETEFSLVRFKGDREKAKQPYKGITPLKAKDVAEVIQFVIKRPDNVLLSDIVMFPKSQASATLVKRDPS
ncbi:MAG: SDR family NAD(P)-dependent oxidoreductase [Chitinophagaceae bacterium]|nr:SDR family NAD(P)-dependent oxidoreductase [Chitinophagaceae bacterium]